MNEQKYDYFVRVTDYMDKNRSQFKQFKNLEEADGMLDEAVHNFLRHFSSGKNCRVHIGVIESNKTFARMLHVIEFVPIGQEFYPVMFDSYKKVLSNMTDENTKNSFANTLFSILDRYKPIYEERTNPFLEKLGISSFFAPHDRNTERDFAAKDIVLDKNALLCPCEELKLESSIEEIYIKSEGWMTCDNLKAYMEQKKPWEHPVIEKICAQYVDFLGHQSSMDMSVEKFMNQSNLQDGKNVTVYCTDLINKVEIPVASFESSDEAIVAMEKLTLPYCYEDLNYYYDKKNMLYLEKQ